MASWKDKLALTAQRNRQEIVRAKLTRRDMMRAGLLTASGSLIVKAGLSSRAFADGGSPASPPTTPWTQLMPLLPVKQPVLPDAMEFGAPDGTTPIERATERVNHQLFTATKDPVTGVTTYGGTFPPVKFYEMNMIQSAQTYALGYSPTTVWAFDGDVPGQVHVPGPLIQARYGEPILVRFKNKLPSVKTAQNFGIAEMTTHLHNGHTPTESDGNPVNYFNSINDPNAINPDGFKDQHYPNIYAGYSQTPSNGNSFVPAASNSIATPAGDKTEAMGSLWYHDHHLDFTAQNVYKGMFGCYNLFDNADTGDETSGLHLPSGKYDVPIMFSDPLFDQSCQLVFDLFNLDGIIGDKFAANGIIQPYFNVDKRRYRFRFYAPGPSRWWEFALFDGTNHLPFWQISSDGNLLPNPVQVSSVRIGVAERVDVIIDFGKIAASKLYLVNILEQTNGRQPTGNILNPGTALVQFNVGKKATDNSQDPAAGPMPMRVLPDPDMNALLARAAKAKVRNFTFSRGNGAWQVNGAFFDETVVSANPTQESEEVWVITNGGGGWMHPVHIHYEEHRVLTRNGVTVTPNTQINSVINYARKDVIPLADGEQVKIFMRFRDMKGRYVMHCHNVVHEDHAMMVRWDIT
jgi:FtsP/CotA-like multicopper oxidase with cupredoxin domain